MRFLAGCTLFIVLGNPAIGTEPSLGDHERLKISVAKLKALWEGPSKVAREQILGKNVALRGRVIDVDQRGITLEYCRWLTEQKHPWKKVLPGQTVTLHGTLESGVFMSIAKVEGERLTVDAAQLNEDFRLNPTTTNDRYHKRWMEVHGEIAMVEFQCHRCVCTAIVHCRGVGEDLIVCRFVSIPGSLKKLQPGSTVRFVAQYQASDKSGSNFELVRCMIDP